MSDPKVVRRGGHYMAERWIGVQVSVVRFVSDDPQPGLIEAELRDVRGRCWRFVEKCSAVENLDLDAETVYPQAGVILCRVVGHSRDESGREMVEVELYGVISVDGEDRFTVRPDALVEGEFNSSARRPWDGHADPNAVPGPGSG